MRKVAVRLLLWAPSREDAGLSGQGVRVPSVHCPQLIRGTC